jgi:hypothetical protein
MNGKEICLNARGNLVLNDGENFASHYRVKNHSLLQTLEV